MERRQVDPVSAADTPRWSRQGSSGYLRDMANNSVRSNRGLPTTSNGDQYRGDRSSTASERGRLWRAALPPGRVRWRGRTNTPSADMTRTRRPTLLVRLASRTLPRHSVPSSPAHTLACVRILLDLCAGAATVSRVTISRFYCPHMCTASLRNDPSRPRLGVQTAGDIAASHRYGCIGSV